MYNYNNNNNGYTRRRNNARMQARLKDKHRRIKNKKQKYMLYYIFFAVVILSSTITLSLTAFFKIEHIKFKCSGAKVSDMAILKTIGLNYGDNLIVFNSEKAIKKLLDAFPKLSYAEINKQFPNSIDLVCRFDAPVFFVENQKNQLIGIAQSGRAIMVCEKNKIAHPINKLIMKIPTKLFSSPKLGEFIKLPPQISQTLHTVLHTANLANLNNITKIELNEKLESTFTYDNRIEIEALNISKAKQIILSTGEIINNIIGRNEEGTISYFPDDKTIHFIPKQNPFLMFNKNAGNNNNNNNIDSETD